MPETSFLTKTLLRQVIAGMILLAGSSGASFAGADVNLEAAILSTFEEINKIPRCSKDEGRISAWLVDWARARELAVSSDAHRNVLITVPATPGWEARPGVILQAHMDMVCVKTEISQHDFTKDPIPLIRDGEWVRAKDTSLGADDGIGIAMALTLAEKATRSHPKLELLFTTDEEQEMTGAAALSPDLLTGKRYINLDSENDSTVTLGAAGGLHTDIRLPLAMSPLPTDMDIFRLKVSGLLGGHSGLDIDKNRANANVLLARLLTGSAPFRLAAFSGGSAGNAIATSAESMIAVARGDAQALQKRLADYQAEARAAFPEEAELSITLTSVTNTGQPAAMPHDSATAMKLISSIPQGVTAWSKEFAGLPETSNNIGIVRSSEGALDIATFQRSFHSTNMEAIAGQIVAIAQAAGATTDERGAFPSWPPDSSTGLYKGVVDAYSRLFGSTIKTEVLHAGLECGHIAAKYPSLEIVSIGPTLENVHTTNERLKVASLVKMWDLVQEVLQAP
jgi:dipeptidase D